MLYLQPNNLKLESKRYTVTAALPYANGPVHIGHLAGCYLPADIYVRYLRRTKKDKEIVFICGSDEHGVAITMKAKNEGLTSQQVIDKYHGIISQAFKDFGIEFDIYSRTSSPIHHQTAQDFFTELLKKGEFEVKETEQYFDEVEQKFLADRYIVGTCPNCKNENAYGDQCEKCGSSLSPTDLINPKSKLSDSKPVLKKTKNWFLKMDTFQDRPEFQEYLKRIEGWKVNVKGQMKSWLDQKLQSRSMTRDLDWGIPVPLDEAKGKVLYVWFDAPIGYISATKELFLEKAKNIEEQDLREISENKWKAFWKKDESEGKTELIHFIGKDNIVFHTIIFPMILQAHGEFINPTNVPANEFLNLENDKISTSRNWAVWLHEYLQDFPGQQDELRYVLTANMPETKDNNFIWKYVKNDDSTTDSFQAKVNNELVAILGNFVNRVMVLSNKYYEGIVPNKSLLPQNIKESIEDLKSNINKASANSLDAIEEFRFRDALTEFMNIARAGNKFLTETEPWKLQKNEPEVVKTIMNVAVQVCAQIAAFSEIFLPKTAKKIKAQLNIENLVIEKYFIDNQISANHQLGTPGLLFKNIEDEQMDAQLAKLQASKSNNEAQLAQKVAEAKEEVSFDDFSKMDIRVGTILEAEKVAKTKKLLKLTIDTGLDVRTVVSGIAEYYEPENIIGQKVCLLANLAPREIKGIESRGMILMAENGAGKLCFVSPIDAFDNGSTVK